MKLATVIPYLKKILQKSRDTTLELTSAFFTENQKFLLYQEIQV